MTRSFFLFFCFCLITICSQAQISTPSSPDWVQLMYADSAELGPVMRAYDAYYDDHPFVKNQHTQYLKRWKRKTATYEYHFSDTRLSANQKQQLQQSEQDYVKRNRSALSRNNGANWSCVGPFDWDHEAADRSYAAGAAHVYTVESCAAAPEVLYAGTATAGVWKSTDYGQNWTNLTADMMVNKVVAIEIDPEDPKVVFAGMQGSIYRTTDGGDTWQATGNPGFQSLPPFDTYDIRMHTAQAGHVFAATSEGLFRSHNNGNTWTEVLSGNVQEIEFHPTNDQIIYAVRQITNRTEFFKSVNGGEVFTNENIGWPSPSPSDGENKRAEIAVSPAAPNRVYAILVGEINGGVGLYGIYISENEGNNWSFTCCGPQAGGVPDLTTQPPNINLMGWDDEGTDNNGQHYYDLALAVSPTDPDFILVGGVNLWESRDGGQTFNCPAAWNEAHLDRYVHADIHDIHFLENDHIWVACDGGIFYSKNQNAASPFERRIYGIAATEFWGFEAGFWNDEVMLGGAYHNGTQLKNGNVYENGWVSIDGGDGSGGDVNHGTDNEVYTFNNIKKLSDSRTEYMGLRFFPQKPKTNSLVGLSTSIVSAPHCYETQFFGGEDGGLWKTEDNHLSVQKVYDFPETENVADIEIGWNNTDTIYVTTWDSYDGPKKVYRTRDGGQSWVDVTPSEAVFEESREIPYDLVVSDESADMLWLARVGRPTGDLKKVFRSDDGGDSWINITTPDLAGEVLTNITYQRGSQDALYLGTSRTVYFKDAEQENWELYNNGLPLSTFSRRLQLNYRTGSLLNGTNRSVWRSPVKNHYPPKAQITVDKTRTDCARDTFYFTDYSALHAANASWEWSFSGAVYVSSTTERTAKVVFGNTGQYDVSLTVTNALGSDTQTLENFISVGNKCQAEPFPGQALATNEAGDFLEVQDAGLHSNTLTFSAWVKPKGIQNNLTGILINDSPTAGLNLKYNNELGYHWKGGNIHADWSSGLYLPPNQWSYVAMVVQSNKLTIYLNDQKAERSILMEPITFNNFKVGSYRGWLTRNFFGEIDEVAIWNRALSQDEIRRWRHLTKEGLANPQSSLYDESLWAYYQFNDEGALIYDRAGAHHGSLNGDFAMLPASSAPVGGGKSAALWIDDGGTYNFENAKVTFYFPQGGSYPEEELVVSRLEVPPSGGLTEAPYWIVNNYGNPVVSPVDSIRFDGPFPPPTEDMPVSIFHLYRRPANAHGQNWELNIDEADLEDFMDVGMSEIRFNDCELLDRFGQLLLSREPKLPSASIHFRANPMDGGHVKVAWETEYLQDVTYFEVEKSTDGRNWAVCSPIYRKGMQETFDFLDQFAFGASDQQQELQYRLKIYQSDDQYRYSPIRIVRQPMAGMAVRLSPNPTDDWLYLDIDSQISGDVILEVFASSGQLMWQQSLSLSKGHDRFGINLGNIPAGIYQLRLHLPFDESQQQGSQSITKRIVVR